MTRRANSNGGPTLPGFTLKFAPHEFRRLKRNPPGGGGWQQFENILIEQTDPGTLTCPLNPTHLERLIRYCKSYGPGGPNKRIREACIPALRRIGIDVAPEWRAPP